MQVIAAARTSAELTVLERRLQTFPPSPEREQLADLCVVRRAALETPDGSIGGAARPNDAA